jgi:GntR family transcriptional regulator of vanillate catabolism
MSEAVTKQSPLARLREMILTGELQPGERITEVDLSNRLGVSRTPVRSALLVLEADGYLEIVGKRGYAVKHFDGEEAFNALELRSILEGVAAQKLARKGASTTLLSALDNCLKQGDEIFSKRHLTNEDESRYGDMNATFHDLIVQHCGSQVLIDSIEKLNKMPFINPSVLVFDKVGLDKAYDILFKAHGQHHALVDAIKERDGARAEAVFREHGNAQKQSLDSRMNKDNALLREESRK